jgi:3',5'-cyclic AMP phosphodiesterase CpdA
VNEQRQLNQEPDESVASTNSTLKRERGDSQAAKDGKLVPGNTSQSNLVRILHVSDLHFGRPYVREVGEALLRTAASLPVDVLVVSGDLTQRARISEFIDAKEFIERLPQVPRIVIPGNHDVPLYDVARRLGDPHRNYREIISAELNPIVHVPGATIVGLDSTAPRSAISNGRIHAWQLDYVEQAFEQAGTSAIRIVVAHHHFAPAPDYLHDSTMPKAKRAIMRFVENGVELILGGHLHRSYIGNTLDFYPGAHRDQGIVVAQSGTTTSRRGRGREQQKNTFNYICVDDKIIKVTHFLYFQEKGFVATSCHEFSRDPSVVDALSL